MTDRPTPEQIATACEQESTHDFLHALRRHGYAIVDADRGGELARMGCPCCPPDPPPTPVMRCMLCGTAWYDTPEADR